MELDVRIGIIQACRHGKWLAHRLWWGKLCWPNFMVSDQDHHVLYSYEGRNASVQYTSDDLIGEFEKYADWPK